MENYNTELYGIKCARLLELSKYDNFKKIIPPIYPIDASICSDFCKSIENKDLTYKEIIINFIDYFGEDNRKNKLIDSIQAVCGNTPWIIRSSGDEDNEININAGGYESIVCKNENEFVKSFAEAIFSGYKTKAIKQNKMMNNEIEYKPEVIPVFIQPLVTTQRSLELKNSDVPYLNEEQQLRLKRYISQLHNLLKIDKLDCEWVIKTDVGVISVTSFTIKEGDAILGQISFGFDLFSTQLVSVTPNSTLYWISNKYGDIWNGKNLREVKIESLNLVQARPCKNYNIVNKTKGLKKSSTKLLIENGWKEFNATNIILSGKEIKIGKFIKAKSLYLAWNMYLSLNESQRKSISAVFVEYGSRNEHSGIMFSSTGIVVLNADINRIPSYCDYVIVDSINLSCYFSNQISALNFETEEVCDITLPHDCFIVHDNSMNCDELLKGDLLNSNLNNTDEIVKSIPKLSMLNNMKNISESKKKEILHNSIYPNEHSFIRGNQIEYPYTIIGRAYSIILSGHLSSREMLSLSKLWNNNSQCENILVSMYLTKKTDDINLIFKNLNRKFSKYLIPLLKLSNLSINYKLLCLDDKYSDLSNVFVEYVLKKSCELSTDSNNIKCIHLLLELIFLLKQRIGLLPVYTDNEVDEITLLFGNIILYADEKLVEKIHMVLENGLLAISQEVEIISKSIKNPHILQYYMQFLNTYFQFNNILGNKDEIENFASKINTEYNELKAVIYKHQLSSGILSNLYNCMTESYDSLAKEILFLLLKDESNENYRLYLNILLAWLNFISSCTNENLIIERLRMWINSRANLNKSYRDYYLEDIHWKTYIDVLKRENYEYDVIKNPHQIHNLLHQWSLFMMPKLEEKDVPEQINYMLTFVNSFGDKDKRLLRFQRDMFEIEPSKCTHKAGIIFKKEAIYIEHNEMPETPDNKIVRLLFFKGFIEKFNDWFDDYIFTSDYEKIAGTWTMFINIIPNRKESFTSKDFKKIFNITQFLFDGANDYAHWNNELADNISERFNNKDWKEIIEKLIEYRANFRYKEQYIDPKLYAFATIFTQLTKVEEFENIFLESKQNGLDSTVKSIIYLEKELQENVILDRWISAYNKVNYLSLLISSVWIDESFEVLINLKNYPIISDILAKNLFNQKNVVNKLLNYINKFDNEKSYILELCLHYAPEILLRDNNQLNKVVKLLLKTSKNFKRAKELILYKYASFILIDDIKKITNQLDRIPYGIDNTQEKILARLACSKNRFDIKNAITELN